jgi:hypothetical protein
LRFLQGFGKKTKNAKFEHCIVCTKELTGHKYKPSAEWYMEGLLCSDCHIEKTKEFMLKAEAEKKQEAEKKEKQDSTCYLCNTVIALDTDKKKPEWKWNMNAETVLCPRCYEKMEADFDKKLNFCAICNKKMGFIRYNPKPKWRIDGQLCRRCWDEQNVMSKKIDR